MDAAASTRPLHLEPFAWEGSRRLERGRRWERLCRRACVRASLTLNRARWFGLVWFGLVGQLGCLEGVLDASE